MSIANDAALIEFVYHEARLIDEKRFDEWYDLYADDGRYWMPLAHGQPEGGAHTSLFDEDKLLLKIRIERLRNPKSYSQAQPSWCQHILQAPKVESRDPEHAGGRGLQIVNSLARDWGVTASDEGKMVWAEVGFDEADD